MLLIRIKAKMLMAYHLQTNGVSKRTNKTVEQCLQFHVKRNQKGWKRVLPRIHFQMMNTVNKSTKFTPFQLRFGKSPRILPAMVEPRENASIESLSARAICDRVAIDVADAHDNLMIAKISQSFYANACRTDVKVIPTSLHSRSVLGRGIACS